MLIKKFKTIFFGLMLAGMLSTAVSLPAQRLITQANLRAQGSLASQQVMQQINLNPAQGSYHAYNDGGEPGLSGVVTGLSLALVCLYFVQRSAAVRKKPAARLRAASAPAHTVGNDSPRLTNVSDMPIPSEA